MLDKLRLRLAKQDSTASDELQRIKVELTNAGLKPIALQKHAGSVLGVLRFPAAKALFEDSKTKLGTAQIDVKELTAKGDDVRKLLEAEGPLQPQERSAAEEQAATEPATTFQGEAFLHHWSGMTDAEAADVLATVRARAEAWRTGTTTVLGLITAALVVTNTKDTVRLFDHGEVRALLAVLLMASAGCGLVSLGLAIRAANGPAWLDTKVKERVTTPVSTSRRDLSRAQGAAKDLWRAQRLLWFAISCFVVLVACLWAVPHEWNPL